jgi:hypothetical protein
MKFNQEKYLQVWKLEVDFKIKTVEMVFSVLSAQLKESIKFFNKKLSNTLRILTGKNSISKLTKDGAKELYLYKVRNEITTPC